MVLEISCFIDSIKAS